MTSRPFTTVENNFTKGFVSEFTGLNFPENAATDTDNCLYSLVGDVTRRLGIDLETNFTTNAISRTGVAFNTYEWNNVAGQGLTQFLVNQVGATIYFYDVTASTILSPLSAHKLVTTVDLNNFAAVNGTLDATLECQFTSGNGFLFVYHPSCDPLYCEYTGGTVTGTRINIQVRDFTGVIDGLAVNTRPSTLSNPHTYNLGNQGWVAGAAWSASETNGAFIIFTAPQSIAVTVAAGITGITPGDAVSVIGNFYALGPSGPSIPNYALGSGNVTSYAGTTLTINMTSGGTAVWGSDGLVITPTNIGYISTWNTQVGGYPSNADVWWFFKNTTDVFNPGTTLANVTLNTGNAPRGHYIFSAFNQNRNTIAALTGITTVTTTARPTNGTWFQGRVWYTGVNGYQATSATTNAYAWTESIYFSQVITDPSQFGNCFQVNDPTSETLFGLLPTDGGTIYIQGSGTIFKLFPYQNGLLVFAANGIWFITGSQGIGFSANDYTITEISRIKCISTSSFVDVQGLPYFWNEDGIYAVMPQQGGGLGVQTITYSTIDTYYSEIPLSSKKLARGDFDPINYTIKWIFKDTEATDVTDRYTFNKILNYNTANKAFFPYTVSTTAGNINSINFISPPGGSTSPPPAFKFFATYTSGLSIADEHNTTYLDWTSTGTSVDYTSYFVTGYKLHGQAQRRFQMPYLYMFSRNDTNTAYKIQGIWDYAISGNSGRWSTAQLINIWSPNYGMVFRRHRIRGQGLVLQIKVTSVTGTPFDIMGWSAYETQNTSP